MAGTERAMRTMEHLQLDPLAIMARAQDLMLHSRVIDYRPDDWATLTYGRRKFFDWGGWLAVRPMEELPYWRNLMRREKDNGHWREVELEHHETMSRCAASSASEARSPTATSRCTRGSGPTTIAVGKTVPSR